MARWRWCRGGFTKRDIVDGIKSILFYRPAGNNDRLVYQSKANRMTTGCRREACAGPNCCADAVIEPLVKVYACTTTGFFAATGFRLDTACIQDGTDNEFVETSRGSGAIVKLEWGPMPASENAWKVNFRGNPP